MATPVTKRSTSAPARPLTKSASQPLASAPTIAPAIITRREGRTSGRLASAAPRVPTMKPAWTAMVSAALPPSPSAHSRRRAGRMAEALNQRQSASSSASDSTVSCHQRSEAGAVTLDLSGRAGLLDDLARAQAGDVARRHAEILEDRLGVLAAQRCGGAHRARGVRQLDGD